MYRWQGVEKMNLYSRRIAIVTLCTAFLFFLLHSSPSLGKQETVHWQIIKNAFDKYLDYPSTENATLLCDVLPQEDIKNLGEDYGVSEYLYKNYEILAYEMKCGDKNAVKAAFSLFNISDGAFTEEIEWSLAELIRIQPKLFLEELELHKNGYFIREVDYPLFGEGIIFLDKMRAQTLESEMRIKALESVTDERLRPIRDECIKRLNDHIRKYR
jgi:hypothetical protein